MRFKIFEVHFSADTQFHNIYSGSLTSHFYLRREYSEFKTHKTNILDKFGSILSLQEREGNFLSKQAQIIIEGFSDIRP